MEKELTYQLVNKEAFKGLNLERMYELMHSNYNAVNKAQFLKDLFAKDYCGVFLDDQLQIQGFTTYGVNPKGTGTPDYNIIFSGDTIISPEFWGTQIMMASWCRTVGSLIMTDTNKKWYWYLLSKGHRTYLYLPLFFQKYYPSPDENNDDLKEIMDDCSNILYPNYYDKNRRIVRFDNSMGELKPELIDETLAKRKSSFISFFLEKNPEFHEGVELVCLTEIHPSNMKRSAKTFMEEGMKFSLLPTK